METNNDIQILKDLISGLEEKQKTLQADKDIFTRAQGLEVSAEKLRGDAQRFTVELVDLKSKLKELQEQKRTALMPTIVGLEGQMDSFLAAGSASLQIVDGKFLTGWRNDKGSLVPYAGLSGGEKISFDLAFAKALGATIICGEMAELDDKRLAESLEKYATSNLQVILSSCHEPVVIPEGWEVTDLG